MKVAETLQGTLSLETYTQLQGNCLTVVVTGSVVLGSAERTALLWV